MAELLEYVFVFKIEIAVRYRPSFRNEICEL